MNYRVLIDARAARFLESLVNLLVNRIDEAILALAANPRPSGCKLLKGRLGEGWRIRVGQYRILYRIDDEAREVRIFNIGHRREIYR